MKNLNKIRKEQGFTWDALADKIAEAEGTTVSSSALVGYGNGSSSPNIHRAIAISAALDCSVYDLV